MKKGILFLLLTIIIFFPPISIFFTTRIAIELRKIDREQEISRQIEQNFQNIDRLQNFSNSVVQEINTRKVELLLPDSNFYEKAKKGLLGETLKEKFRGFTKKFIFPVQLCIMYLENGALKTLAFGPEIGLSKILNSLKSTDFVKNSKLTRPISFKDLQLTDIQQYIHNFAQNIKTKDIAKISFKFNSKKHTFVQSFLNSDNPTDKNEKIVSLICLADLSDIDYFDSIRLRIKKSSNPNFSLAAYEVEKKEFVGSKDFLKNSNIKKYLKEIFKKKNLPGKTFIYPDLKIKISQKDSRKNYYLIAVIPRQKVILKNFQILLAFVFFFSCVVFKVMAEKLFLQRGPELSLSKLIPGTFVLLILQPVFASTYIAEEFINTEYMAKRNRINQKLSKDLKDMDAETNDNFREAMNLVRGLNTVEKIKKFANIPDEENSSAEIGKRLLQKLDNKFNASRYSSLWIYTLTKKMVAFRKVKPGEYKAEETDNPIADIFQNRFSEMLHDSLGNQKNTGKKFNADSLKAEIARGFFTNLLGPEAFYNFRNNIEILIDIYSFYKRDFICCFPISYHGKPYGIIAWHSDTETGSESFPKQKLTANTSSSRVIIFGDEKKIQSLPISLPVLENDYPDLSETAKIAHLARSNIVNQIQKGDHNEIVEAFPANYSYYTIVGHEILQKYENFRTKIGLETIKFIFALFCFGTLVAWSGAHYFTAPIKELTAATEQINQGNFATLINDSHPDEFARIGNSFNKMARGLHEGKILKSFVSESVLREVSSGSEKLAEKAKQSFATIIFSGIKDFKNILDKKDATEIFELMQKHLTVAGKATSQFGGEIDKMIEDKIMIVFEHDPTDKKLSQKPLKLQ